MKHKANGVKNKHGASKIIDTLETYHGAAEVYLGKMPSPRFFQVRGYM
jgi:hypothetical protein